MLGIFLTLIAVLVVICFSFYYSENPSGRERKAEALFFLPRNNPKKRQDNKDLCNSRGPEAR